MANVIIEVMTDDPSKIIEAHEDAEFMKRAGADFGESRASLMAEYALSVFKAQNANGGFPELKEMTEADEEVVESLIEEHIEQAGW